MRIFATFGTFLQWTILKSNFFVPKLYLKLFQQYRCLANPYKMGIKNESTVKCSLQGEIFTKCRLGLNPCKIRLFHYLSLLKFNKILSKSIQNNGWIMGRNKECSLAIDYILFLSFLSMTFMTFLLRHTTHKFNVIMS